MLGECSSRGHNYSLGVLLNTILYMIILSEMRSKCYLILCIRKYCVLLKAEFKLFSDKNWKVEMAEKAVWRARTGSLQWLRELFGVQELGPCSG